MHSLPGMIYTESVFTFVRFTRYIKDSNLRKEVGIATKSKETINQLETVRNSHV